MDCMSDLNLWNSDRNCRFPIGNSNYRSDFWKSDRKSRIPIGILDFRSEIQFADPISNFPIFDFFFFLQKLIKEKNKKENAFEAKKYPV